MSINMGEHARWMQGFNAYCDGLPEPTEAGHERAGWRTARAGAIHAGITEGHIAAGGCPIDADTIAKSITVKEYANSCKSN